jgi:hypothetical protein
VTWGTGRTLAVVAMLAIAAVFAASAGAKSGKHKAAKDHAYSVDFTGTGSWASDENDAVEGINQCSNATDEVNENDDLKWDVEYLIKIPAKGTTVEIYKGTYFKAGDAQWTQLSTVTPTGCLGGNQDCSGKLFPASADYPPVQGFDQRPEALIDPEKSEIEIQADSVLGWVVAEPTGSSSCSVYGHYHSALEPFALAKQLHATTRTVEQAMKADVFIPRSKLDGRSYTKTIKPIEDLQPQRSCQSYTIDAIACAEVLTWKGQLKFTPIS